MEGGKVGKCFDCDEDYKEGWGLGKEEKGDKVRSRGGVYEKGEVEVV